MGEILKTKYLEREWEQTLRDWWVSLNAAYNKKVNKATIMNENGGEVRCRESAMNHGQLATSCTVQPMTQCGRRGGVSVHSDLNLDQQYCSLPALQMVQPQTVGDRTMIHPVPVHRHSSRSASALH